MVVEFSVEDEADDHAVSEAVFDLLVNWEDAPYESCDDWDMSRA